MQEYITARRTVISQKLEVTQEMVVQELARSAFLDPRAMFNDHGLKSISDLDEDVARALAAIDITEEFDGRGEEREQIGYTKKIKFHDKLKALELLGKHLGMFVDQVKHSGDVKITPVLNVSVSGDQPKPSSETG